MGLGVEANTGAELHMDRCVVENNSLGGLLIDGVTYDISNSVFAGNGYGVRFNAPYAGFTLLVQHRARRPRDNLRTQRRPHARVTQLWSAPMPTASS